MFSDEIIEGIPSKIPSEIRFDENLPHAPNRPLHLSKEERILAVHNALRYFPKSWHATLSREFLEELESFGHIYMYRFMPESPIFARGISEYPANTKSAAAIMMMIQNNLDPEVAQYPQELITYGGNGAVFQNWAQYRLTMQYLSKISENQTLVMYSGHPLGLFPSDSKSPTVVVTNGMVVPNYSKQRDYEKMSALGVSQYGQMTAGSYMYIGPQGIVHGTTITILNAARKYLHRKEVDGLDGVIYVTSGLGGMSGAQAKASVIAGAICIIAEIDSNAAEKRLAQGWLTELFTDLEELYARTLSAKQNNEAVSLGYLGNIVDLLEFLVAKGLYPDLASDQTSLHNPWLGGYMPAGYSFEDGLNLLRNDPESFKEAVKSSLRRHVDAINTLTKNGTVFWDYGNAFLLEASRSGAEILDDQGRFKYPSYVEDIMGPLCFDYGFGPFRWVCCSSSYNDLDVTDEIACKVLMELSEDCPENIRTQYEDNIRWITEAKKHKLVVGSKARILYADEIGRRRIAQEFNAAIADGRVSAPIVLGRDHHDVSGTDSPYRETANISDGSMFTADMSVQNFVGDAFRGATWVSLHNGGGVGWGEAINGGFGMVIDGSKQSEIAIDSMISWDVNNGLARRSWARNSGAIEAVKRAMKNDSMLEITVPNLVDNEQLSDLLDDSR